MRSTALIALPLTSLLLVVQQVEDLLDPLQRGPWEDPLALLLGLVLLDLDLQRLLGVDLKGGVVLLDPVADDLEVVLLQRRVHLHDQLLELHEP